MNRCQKRWNGWGHEHTSYPLPPSAAVYLQSQIGAGQSLPDATLAGVLASLPASRLPAHPLVSADPETRLRHARGHSLPDWIALRSGRVDSFPDGVAYPTSAEEVRSLLAYARQSGVVLIPYGGGSSVVGHINPLPGDTPCLTIDLSRLHRLLSLDETSHLATFEAGVRGPHLERQLRAHGYTLGHFPQSYEFSTLGGWISTRSSGQQSYYYGRIEDTFAGGHLETPAGPLHLPPLPASGAGPDLRHLVLGSEGRLGLLTQAAMRVRPLPAAEGFYGVFFREWEAGAVAVREIAQAGLPVSMLRLSDAVETHTTLALSGKERLVAWADRALRLLGYGPERALLIFGVTGQRRAAGHTREQVFAASRAHGGLAAGDIVGKTWRKSRFLTPYLRNTLWEHGYALDTVETAVPWKDVLPVKAAIQTALYTALTAESDRALVFSHLSHVYRTGASIYTTFLFRRSPDPEATLQCWQVAKAAVSQLIVDLGGTISHQHGVGVDHAPYLQVEKGALGLAAIESACRQFDPDGIMNPHKLLI